MNQKLASGLEPFNEKSDRLLMKKKMYQMVLSWQAPRHVNSVANVLSLEYGEFLEICFKRGCGWSLIFNKKNNVSAHFCRFATNLLGSFPKYDARNTRPLLITYSGQNLLLVVVIHIVHEKIYIVCRFQKRSRSTLLSRWHVIQSWNTS